ncbi:hypothetical protein HanRHA438_Chr15g0714621 [Helianthus annuus]|nr:hypothetical protein HanIR_Chr15g0763801 [Helianthus annuus]KAJ0845520.1 hypothetical protein HanRHA438_Chr15g0714621 [Helianthus annuus]
MSEVSCICFSFYERPTKQFYYEKSGTLTNKLDGQKCTSNAIGTTPNYIFRTIATSPMLASFRMIFIHKKVSVLMSSLSLPKDICSSAKR